MVAFRPQRINQLAKYIMAKQGVCTWFLEIAQFLCKCDSIDPVWATEQVPRFSDSYRHTKSLVMMRVP